MANDINKVVLVGRLTRESELKYSSSGTAIANFSLAVNEKYGETEYCSFFDCVLFGKIAEALNQYLSRGKQVVITGKLKQERWEKDNQKRSKVVVKVDEIQMIGSNGDSAKQAKPQNNQGFAGSVGNDDSNDIPF